MRVVPCRTLILLFLYYTWIVPRRILLMLLSIVCVLHIAKSCFYWLNIAWCSHIVPCRILVLLILRCILLTLWEVLFLLFLHYIWLYLVIFNWNSRLSVITCSWVLDSSYTQLITTNYRCRYFRIHFNMEFIFISSSKAKLPCTRNKTIFLIRKSMHKLF